jgi:hypothetical protein
MRIDGSPTPTDRIDHRRRRAAAASAAFVVLALLLGLSPWSTDAASASTPADAAALTDAASASTPADAAALADAASPMAAPSIGASDAAISPRARLPIAAGTRLQISGGTCTAGVVLSRTNLLSRVSPSLAATRYVVTAKHCGGLGTAVKVGGVYVGDVTYVSRRWDFSVITVGPESHQLRHCSVTVSGHPSCYVLPTYTPRAVGEIEMSGRGSPFGGRAAIPGLGAPAAREGFCSSGAVSGWYCGFHAVAPPEGLEVEGGDRAAQSFAGHSEGGDSGGPMASAAGRIYGIIIGTGTLGTQWEYDVYYISIDTVMQELVGYQLAPS